MKRITRIMLTVSQELNVALQAATTPGDRSHQIEQWLWKIKAVRQAAERIDLQKPTRPTRGRPRKAGKP